MLLTEYGFVIGAENDYNVVEVDKYIEGLFEAQGREGELKVGVLKDEGYWGCVRSSPAGFVPLL